jgi:hypothetical protein
MRTWLNLCPDKPCTKVDYEYLPEYSGLALTIIQGAYKTKQYITGGYQAQVQFKLVYRTICGTVDERIKADEVLNTYAEWCENNLKMLEMPTDNMRARKVQQNSESVILSRYDGNIEDHHILMTLIYEVNV